MKNNEKNRKMCQKQFQLRNILLLRPGFTVTGIKLSDLRCIYYDSLIFVPQSCSTEVIIIVQHQWNARSSFGMICASVVSEECFIIYTSGWRPAGSQAYRKLLTFAKHYRNFCSSSSSHLWDICMSQRAQPRPLNLRGHYHKACVSCRFMHGLAERLWTNLNRESVIHYSLHGAAFSCRTPGLPP